MKKIVATLVGILLSCAGQAGEIAAVVNDTPISGFDVTSRAQMMMVQRDMTGDIPDTFKDIALADLIDERIKLLEAQKRNIQVTDADVMQAVAHLENQNGLEPGAFQKMLADKNIPFDTLFVQIMADLSWVRVMQKENRLAEVTDDEVQARVDLLRQKLATESLMLAEIVVATEEQAQDIWQQLQTGGDFRSMAEAYSTAASRTNGGKVSDVTYQYYGQDVAPVLEKMIPGQLSEPVKVKNGYALILMLDKRPPITTDTVKVWELAQAVVASDSQVGKQLNASVSGCDAFLTIMAKEALPGSVRRGHVSPEQLPAEVLNILQDKPFQKTVGPVHVPNGMLYFMKCGQVDKRMIPEPEEIRAQIIGEKSDRIARQFLAEVKRDIVVEYKD